VSTGLGACSCHLVVAAGVSAHPRGQQPARHHGPQAGGMQGPWAASSGGCRGLGTPHRPAANSLSWAPGWHLDPNCHFVLKPFQAAEGWAGTSPSQNAPEVSSQIHHGPQAGGMQGPWAASSGGRQGLHTPQRPAASLLSWALGLGLRPKLPLCVFASGWGRGGNIPASL
jgi:hypothetical protein